MHERRYRSGDTIFRHSDPSDVVYLIREGSVICGPDPDGGTEEGETASAGEVIGRSGVLTGRPRAYSATALEDVTLLALERAEILAHLERDETLLQNLFALLRPTGDEDGAPVHANGKEAAPASWPKLHIGPADKVAAKTFGDGAFEIQRLPFIVGRQIDGNVADDLGLPDLALPDEPPYWLSRCHFAIETRDSEIVIRDCGSFHGTIVNGRRIGGGRAEGTAPLDKRANKIIAGGHRSPYRFMIVFADEMAET